MASWTRTPCRRDGRRLLAKPSTATARSAADKVRRIVARSQLPDDKVFGELDLIERLRAQHVFPMSMLKLHEHEWKNMLSDASGGAEQPPSPASYDVDGS